MDDVSGLSGSAAAAGASAELSGLAGPGATHGPHAAHATATHCLNCNAPLVSGARFCSQCGQDTANHPPSLMEFTHEFVSHYIAVEGTLWKSLWGLLARPGFLTMEYLAGRKQRYVLPLRLLLTLGLLFFLALKFMPSSTHTLGLDREADDEAFVQVPSDPAEAAQAASAASAVAGKVAKAAKKIGEHRENFNIVAPGLAEKLPEGMRDRAKRAEDHWRADPKGSARAMGATMMGLAPYAVLCSLPFFAGLLKLLFWRQPYGAHFVFAMHLHAAWYAMLLLAVLLPWGAVSFGMWVWSNIYPVLALKRVHAASWWTTLLRAGLLAVLHWILIGLGLLVLVMLGALAAA